MESAEVETPVVVASQSHHAFLCFHALETHLSPDSPASAPHLASEFDALLAEEAFPPCPLFVTWNIKETPSRRDLRGCIGTFQPHSLGQGLKSFALSAALRDTRFPPITSHELPRLHCSVSLLHAFEQAQNWDDWEVGTHGISIHFTHPKEARGWSRAARPAAYSATFLPEVASEQGWGVLETVKHLIRKAGCHIEDGGRDGTRRSDAAGDDDDDNNNDEEEEALVFGRHWDGASVDHGVPLTQLLSAMRVERYQSSKCSASYTEYAAFVDDIL